MGKCIKFTDNVLHFAILQKYKKYKNIIESRKNLPCRMFYVKNPNIM